MIIIRTILFLFIVYTFVGCSREPAQLLLVTPQSPIDREIAQDVVNLLGHESAIKITLTDDAASDEAALDALISGTADIAFVSNSMPFRTGVSTVMPLYPTVLHIGHPVGRDASNIEGLLRGAKVFAGPPGSASRLLFERISSRFGLSDSDFSYLEISAPPESPDDIVPPDVFVVYAPISPDRLEQFPDVRLFSLGSPDDIGHGSLVDAATLMNPHMEAFVIPMGTYGDITPEPILTLAVDMLLVARQDLSAAIVYDLVQEVLRLRPALSALRPGLFRRLSDDFDSSNSTFILHPGLLAYMQRDAPTVYERYSGVAEVAVTVLIALFSAFLAGVRIYRMRRKNRIDTFYSRIIAIRNSIDDKSSIEARRLKADEIRALQANAFELLVDEKLAADESFRIFITLSNDVLRQLGAFSSEGQLSDA